MERVANRDALAFVLPLDLRVWNGLYGEIVALDLAQANPKVCT